MTSPFLEEVGVALNGGSGVPAAPFGHLTLQRRETLEPATAVYHTFGSATGRGRVVGACASLEGRRDRMQHEPTYPEGPMTFAMGDEDINLDGMTLHGTGTEDFFDSSFFFGPATQSTPFAQWGGRIEDAAADYGAITACRWFVLGAALDFSDSLEFRLEIGPSDPTSLRRYVTTLFLYQ